MEKKLKPWKYGVIGIAGSLLGVGFLVFLYLDDSFFGFVFNPLVLLGLVFLGYISGSLGGRLSGSQISTVFAALVGGLIVTIIGAMVVIPLLSFIVWAICSSWVNCDHSSTDWFSPIILIACMIASGYQIIKDFRYGF